LVNVDAIRRGALQIQGVIADYENRVISFPRLVAAIESQINIMIGEADAQWLDELRSTWNRLEFLNALMLDEERPNLRADEEEEVSDALLEIRAMLTEYDGPSSDTEPV